MFTFWVVLWFVEVGMSDPPHPPQYFCKFIIDQRIRENLNIYQARPAISTHCLRLGSYTGAHIVLACYVASTLKEIPFCIICS